MKPKKIDITPIKSLDSPENKELLNDKQIAFLNKMMVEQMSPTDAYMAIYKVANRKTASNAASKLLKKESIKTELSSLANQLKHLANVPKHLVITELKDLLVKVKTHGKEYNPKYIIECLDMINKMMGYYNHATTSVNIQVSQKLDFGGFDPDSGQFIEIKTNEGE